MTTTMIPKEILKKVKQIEIRTGKLVNEVFAGRYESIFKGRGMEFHEVREYVPGDDIRSIDWNVTARTNHPYVKKFVEERELTVLLAVDVSSSGEFGTKNKIKKDLIAELGALLAFSAIKNNDKVGLLLFSDSIEKFIPPKKGRPHVLRVIRELLYYKAKGKKTNINTALEYMGKILKRKVVAFLISDFMDSGYERLLKILNKRHDLIAISVLDKKETHLPDIGIVEMRDSETDEAMYIDTHDENLRDTLLKERNSIKEKRNKLFKAINMDHVEIETHKSYIEPLILFFKERSKRFR